MPCNLPCHECCVVLCCVVSCRVVLLCCVLCCGCVVLYYSVLCCAALCCAVVVLRYAVLQCRAVLCCVVLCAVLCCIMCCTVLLCWVALYCLCVVLISGDVNVVDRLTTLWSGMICLISPLKKVTMSVFPSALISFLVPFENVITREPSLLTFSIYRVAGKKERNQSAVRTTTPRSEGRIGI